MLDHNRPHDGRLLRNFKFASSMDMFGIICESLWEQHNEGDVDLLLAEETKAFETDESAATPPAPPVSPQTTFCEYAAQITQLLAPPLSPLSPLSSLLPRIPSPPLHTSLTYAEAPLGYKAAMIQLRATLPLPVPSPPLFEVEESSIFAATGQTGHTLAHRVDYRFIDTVDASIRASESRAMTAMKEVNDTVTDLATTQRQDAHELHREAVIARQAWSHSEDRSTILEASIRTLEAQEKYGSKTRCWLVLVLAGGWEKGLYKLGCDRERLKMIKDGRGNFQRNSQRREVILKTSLVFSNHGRERWQHTPGKRALVHCISPKACDGRQSSGEGQVNGSFLDYELFLALSSFLLDGNGIDALGIGELQEKHWSDLDYGGLNLNTGGGDLRCSLNSRGNRVLCHLVVLTNCFWSLEGDTLGK
ncbi:hypothetical protein Tco_1104791 [Tanacetum coccineum]